MLSMSLAAVRKGRDGEEGMVQRYVERRRLTGLIEQKKKEGEREVDGTKFSGNRDLN